MFVVILNKTFDEFKLPRVRTFINNSEFGHMMKFNMTNK